MSLKQESKRRRISPENFDPILINTEMETTATTAELIPSPAGTTLDKKELDKFSRQNAALGAETTAKLIKMKVVIYGLRAIGIETAKNLALQGVGALTLIDSEVVAPKDIGQNFFFAKADVGKIRSEVALPKLRDLNLTCAMNTLPSLSEIDLKTINALVITQILELPVLLDLNERCRSHKVSFFYGFTGGITADLFVDHGPEHVVTDFTGERPIQKLITDITQIAPGVCRIRYDTPEGAQAVALYNKGTFEVTEVEGIPTLNNTLFEVEVADNDPVKTIRIKFTIPESQAYISGGLLTEKKIPTLHPSVSLADKLKQPGDVYAYPPTMVQTGYFGHELTQHVCFYAVHVYYTKNHVLPQIRDKNTITEIVQIAQDLLKTKNIDVGYNLEVDIEYMTKYVSFINAQIQPMGAFLGGVLAQEVVKVTGKFTPIPGWFHFSSFESLPDETVVEDCMEKGDARDELASIYGWSFVEKLGNLKYFMVGCGALGCEFLKNFALNNICCGPSGLLTVTDADRIELSNLSRQFLFREHNIGQPKSRAAAVAAKDMNEEFKVQALEVFVGPKSEDVFTDSFWLEIDGVCNALDNMEARMYVDSACVKYEKSLLESGTMGTAGNVDTIVPHKTGTYGEGGAAAEGMGVPMCTLRNFPHLPDHCIEWARDIFEFAFVSLGKNLDAYLSDPTTFERKTIDKAESEAGAAFFDIRILASYARLASRPSIGGAAQCALDLFYLLFRDKLLDLQAAFPKDMRMMEDGRDKGPFWGEKKRYPTPLTFNPQDEAHVSFLMAATVLLAVSSGGLPPKMEGDDSWLMEYRDPNWLRSIAADLTVPTYIKADVSTAGDAALEALKKTLNNNTTAATQSKEETLQILLADLREAVSHIDRGLLRNEPASFEKDDDLNFHVSFVTAAANLRGDNYSIKRSDFQAVKVIAGKIIAAIATTTAAVCGLVILELFKIALNKPTEAYLGRNISLGGNTYNTFDGNPPKQYKTRTETVIPSASTLPEDAFDEHGKIKPEFNEKVLHVAYPEGHTIWDKIVVNGELTIKQFAEMLQADHGLQLTAWDMVYGYRTVESDGKKETMGVSTKVYPPPLQVDYSLLPSLELTLAQASMQIMKTPAAKPTQQYIAVWKDCKAKGSLPVAAVDGEENGDGGKALAPINENMTLKQVLERMSSLGDIALSKHEIESKAVSHIEIRKFVVIPSPTVKVVESGEDVETMAALKVML